MEDTDETLDLPGIVALSFISVIPTIGLAQQPRPAPVKPSSKASAPRGPTRPVCTTRATSSAHA